MVFEKLLKWCGFAVVLLMAVVLLKPQPVNAYTLTEDPQFLIINVADFYFVDWDAPEASWSADIKPDVLVKLDEIKETVGTGTPQRKLAWSTLLEYTDFPMDKPGPDSAYVIQARRIMEVAEEADLPVFMPLNGFQWWNEVPELWNHWDPDGDQTPGCENDRYDTIVGYAGSEAIYSCKFPKLRDPAYRQRFIDGYDPANKWNVEWQDWKTPMELNWRNWGAGGFQLAPPPNIIDHDRSAVSYSDFQMGRYRAILDVIAAQTEKWQTEGKDYLFAGLAIGTEVSLNASVTAADEFEPYGYRGIQDVYCPNDTPECGQMALDHELAESAEMELKRREVVREYLTQRARAAVDAGIPKQRVYTHVWSEAEQGEPRYANYFEASLTPYSRPTLSLYGQAQNPLQLPLLAEALAEHGQPVWGAGEFSTDKTADAWSRALWNTMANTTNPAQIVDVYNWREHVDTPAVGQMRRFLAEETDMEVAVSPVISLVNDPVSTQLEWRLLGEDSADYQQLQIYGRVAPVVGEEPLITIGLGDNDSAWQVNDLEPGVYYWQVRRGKDAVYRESTPQVLFVPVRVDDTIPGWVERWLELEERFR